MKRMLIVALAVLVGAAVFFFTLLSPVKRQPSYTVHYTVSPGESFHEIALNLHQVGVIRSPEAFELWGRLRGAGRSIQAGYYGASSHEWAWEILGRMVRGDTQDTTITIPEGLWLTEMGELAGPLFSDGVEGFLAAGRDSALLANHQVPGDTLEGYLFPSTYRLGPGMPAQELVQHMVATFEAEWRKHLAARARGSRLTRHEIVTLASIVEAEARFGDERPRIAAVYLNRLALDRPLQADPTVVYGLGVRKKRLLYADLEDNSPYNTYRIVGLPPGPIGNPGLASLEAVLSPCGDCNDLYFVARGDGTHLFARTYSEHQANRRLVAREQRAEQGS